MADDSHPFYASLKKPLGYRIMVVDPGKECSVWEFCRQDSASSFEKNGFSLTESGAYECRWSCPESVGRGSFTRILLRDGFELWITDCLLHRDTVCSQSGEGRSFAMVHCGFCLEGFHTAGWAGGHEQFILRSGEHYLFFGDEYSSYGMMTMGVRHFAVSVLMSPEVLLSYFDDERLELSGMLGGIARQCVANAAKAFFRLESITAEMHRALRQILECPYGGASRKLFLESRCLELIAYQLEQLHCSGGFSSGVGAAAGSLHPSEKSGIEKVRRLLLDNLGNPPNLDDLAELAGMSHPKLNRCFRQSYGKTVFQYLRDERFKKARVLIEDQGRTVTEAAYLVGYSSLSHFSKAYKHHYGISPGTEFRSRKTA